jgi:hypothetical protein
LCPSKGRNWPFFARLMARIEYFSLPPLLECHDHPLWHARPYITKPVSEPTYWTEDGGIVFLRNIGIRP